MGVQHDVVRNRSPDSAEMTVLDRIVDIQGQLRRLEPLQSELPLEERCRLSKLRAELWRLQQNRNFDELWLQKN